MVPTLGMVAVSFLSILALLPLSVRWVTIGVVFVMTCLLPLVCIFALYRFGAVSDPGLNKRSERGVPYFIAILCYLGCGYFLFRSGAPLWLVMFFGGGAIAIIINILVNLKWKISAHAASMGGLVALFFRLSASHVAIYDLNLWLSGVVIAAGMVMTARVYLGRHTLMQTLAGVANGFLCVWFMSMIH